MVNLKHTTDILIQTINKESIKFEGKKSKLSGSMDKFSKLGISTKSSYKLPLKDTIGKTFSELQIKRNIRISKNIDLIE